MAAAISATLPWISSEEISTFSISSGTRSVTPWRLRPGSQDTLSASYGDAGGEGNRALPVPVLDESKQRVDVHRRDGATAHLLGPGLERPRPERRSQCGEVGDRR